MRSPLTETIKRVEGMITYVRENLSTDEYMLFLDLLAPEPEPEVKPAKKSRKKSNKPASKSARASGMAAAIKGSLDQQREVVKADPACAYVFPDETPCKRIEDNPVHRKDGGYAGYHEFQPAGKSSAPPAGERSSTNGGATATTPSLETETADVSNVHHAGG